MLTLLLLCALSFLTNTLASTNNYPPTTCIQNALSHTIEFALREQGKTLAYDFGKVEPGAISQRVELEVPENSLWVPIITFNGTVLELDPITFENGTTSVNFLAQSNTKITNYNILLEPLSLDTAGIHVVNLLYANVSSVSTDCHECLPDTHTSSSFTVSVVGFPFVFTFRASNITHHFTQMFNDDTHWVYFVHGSETNFTVSRYLVREQLRAAWTPLWVTIGIFAPLIIAGLIANRFLKGSSETKSSQRLQSLDVFRGMSIVIMVFVNYGGGAYWFFSHSPWDGLTLADIVFPWFMWIMGSSMALSFKNVTVTRENFLETIWRIVRRTLILFALALLTFLTRLGLLVNGNFDMSQARIPGVLQRFAISYFVNALVMVFIPKLQFSPPVESASINHTEKDELFETHREGLFDDVLPYILQWIAIGMMFALYLFLQFFLEVPGCPRGYLGAGGRANGGMYPNCTGGAHGWIDRQFFGDNHIYNGTTSKPLYRNSVPYDPEGILGSLTSITLVYIGGQAGRTLIHYKKSSTAILIRWVAWGLFFGALTLILSFGTRFNGPIPINKNLWSPSFIFANAGTAFVVLSICYILVDIFQWWGGAPFLWVGMNPILIYCGHEILESRFPFSWYIEENTHANWMFMNGVGVTLWCLIACKMYYDDFFIKI